MKAVLWSFIVLLGTATTAAAQQQPAFGRCVPMAERQHPSDVGCFIIKDVPVGVLRERPVYWHIRRVRDAHASHGTIIDAFGEHWRVDIGPGAHAGKVNIGPLPVKHGVRYSALYMEASMNPGDKSAIHTHSGPEAWYTLSGETCLETSKGVETGRATGKAVIVPGGLPMELTATGTTTRRTLVVILHDATKPPTTMETKWKPRGLCK